CTQYLVHLKYKASLNRTCSSSSLEGHPLHSTRSALPELDAATQEGRDIEVLSIDERGFAGLKAPAISLRHLSLFRHRAGRFRLRLRSGGGWLRSGVLGLHVGSQ